jgi:heptosyltransferase II
MSSFVSKTLIIKIGATGDVVRTTSLLHAIEGEIHWLTSGYNVAILPADCPSLTGIFSIEKDLSPIAAHHYHQVLSLDESPAVAAIFKLLSFDHLAGVYAGETAGLTYTNTAAGWFDMSLLSALGKQRADALKFSNRKTYQEMIFEAAGKKFVAEPYWINLPPATGRKGLVGIERRVGERWKGKAWNGYGRLAEALQKNGYDVLFFSERSTLKQYMEDIGGCNYIISGDTLAMHLGIAYGIPTLAIFTCTAPWEIYDYGILHKVVSPCLEESFYKPVPVPAAIEAISVESVLEAFFRMVTTPAA